MAVETAPRIKIEDRLKPQRIPEGEHLREILASQAKELLDEAKKNPEYKDAWTEKDLTEVLQMALPIHHLMEADEVFVNLKAIDDKFVGKFTSLQFHVYKDAPNRLESSIPNQLDYDFIAFDMERNESIATTSSVYFRSDADSIPSGIIKPSQGIDLCPPQKIFPIE